MEKGVVWMELWDVGLDLGSSVFAWTDTLKDGKTEGLKAALVKTLQEDFVKGKKREWICLPHSPLSETYPTRARYTKIKVQSWQN